MCVVRPIISFSHLPMGFWSNFTSKFKLCVSAFAMGQKTTSQMLSRHWKKAYRDLSQGQKLDFQAKMCWKCGEIDLCHSFNSSLISHDKFRGVFFSWTQLARSAARKSMLPCTLSLQRRQASTRTTNVWHRKNQVFQCMSALSVDHSLLELKATYLFPSLTTFDISENRIHNQQFFWLRIWNHISHVPSVVPAGVLSQEKSSAHRQDRAKIAEKVFTVEEKTPIEEAHWYVERCWKEGVQQVDFGWIWFTDEMYSRLLADRMWKN